MRKSFYALTGLALVGAFIADVLIGIHIDTHWKGLGDSGICGQAGFSCAGAAHSPFAELFGLPVAALGQGWYLAVVVMVGIQRFGEGKLSRIPDVLLAASALSVIYSAVLGTVSAVNGYLCPYCMGLYAVNLCLFIAAWIAHPEGLRASAAFWPKLPASTSFYASIGIVATATLVSQWGYAARARAARHAAKHERVELDSKAERATVEVGQSIGRGAKDAPVVIVEFSDFECPHCERLAASLKTVVQEMPQDVRYHFKQYPMDNSCNPNIKKPFHKLACMAAAASICAGRDGGRFWGMHDKLFEERATWKSMGADKARARLKDYAKGLGMDPDRFDACLDDPSVKAQIQADIAQGKGLGVGGTPTFFVNGWKQLGGLPASTIRSLVLQAKTAAKK